MSKATLEQAFAALTSDDDGRVCRDIADAACHDQPQNFFIHVTSLSLTKTADGLIDPKLILSWLLTSLGAPLFFTGLLVPVREAGALVPQLFTAGALRRLPVRKWAWSAGSLLQGLAAAGIAVTALLIEGFYAGLLVVILLAILALARSVCSVSYKDVLGKTVDRSKRGTATGIAGTVSAVLVICFALLLASDIFHRLTLVLAGISIASLLWIMAAVLFTRLTEDPGATDGGGDPLTVAINNLNFLFSDRQLALFILTRGLLIATALAPPFMVALSAGTSTIRIGNLGMLVLASAASALCSSYVWGRLADKSSRKVLMIAALIAAITLAAVVVTVRSGLFDNSWIASLLLFSLMTAWHGVRLGRSTHLIDMADEQNRAVYTALSNTIIGLLLLAGGVFSIVAEVYGGTGVLLVFSVMCAVAVFTASGLEEVQS